MNIPNANRYHNKNSSHHAYGHDQPRHQAPSSRPTQDDDDTAWGIGAGVAGVTVIGSLLVTYPILTLLGLGAIAAIAAMASSED